uniref:Uncharacterized protein n=1 Tax=Gadus morhua TaxID=8049 RepID=A0A8C5B6W5_GADMO
MDGWVGDVTSSLSSFFKEEDSIAQVVEVLKNIGVCSAEDLKFVEAADLAAVLRPIEARKAMACIKNLVTRVEDTSSSISTSQIVEPNNEESFVSDDMSDDFPMSVHSTPKSTATSSPALTIASPTGSESSVREDTSWHYRFDIPWSKMPSSTRQLLDNDNCRRLQASTAQKRLPESCSPDNVKRVCKDAYGCINSEPVLSPGETKLQKQKQEELVKMFKNKDKDAKKIERLMVETFPSQRRDVLSALKETEDFLKEWPFLCQEAGMRLNFKELTGVQLDASFEESTATKFRRILRYFQFGKTESSSEARTILSKALAGGEETSAAVLMLGAHFKEQQDKMFVNVDDTAIGVDMDTTKLPWTPCIVVCGNSPLTAKMFMVAVDQVIVNEQLPCFTKALEMMFCSYYLHNIDYPVALTATLEFLQRYTFSMHYTLLLR